VSHGRVAALLELGSGFNPEFSGRDNVYLNGAILGLSTKEMDRRFPEIEAFAEIGDFIHQPVKTYSSGMAVRLAFAVAIHVDPEILLVDEALAVGDVYFRQRCMRKVHELRQRGITILFVSHATGDVKALGDRAMWLEKGVVKALGKTDLVVAQYLAAMSEKDRVYQASEIPPEEAQNLPAPEEIVEEIPNIDHRFGDGRGEVIGIAVLNAEGSRVASLQPHSTIVVRISVRAKQHLDRPIVGFMFRNHLGVDFAGTNTARERQDLAPMTAGEICTVDFYLDLPALYASSFSFSPAIANGSLEHYSMCDWIDNALVLQMEKSGQPMYGQFHLDCRVKVNTKVGGVVTP
jgi:ABC-type multidrug transport system ATPase subunit